MKTMSIVKCSVLLFFVLVLVSKNSFAQQGQHYGAANCTIVALNLKNEYVMELIKKGAGFYDIDFQKTRDVEGLWQKIGEVENLKPEVTDVWRFVRRFMNRQNVVTPYLRALEDRYEKLMKGAFYAGNVDSERDFRAYKAPVHSMVEMSETCARDRLPFYDNPEHKDYCGLDQQRDQTHIYRIQFIGNCD